MDQHAIGFRRATEHDQRAIRALVRGERLNPTRINWPNFLVAAMADRVVGAAQIRRHSDGSRELGSLVVAKDLRGHGIVSRLIDTLLADEREPIWMITPESHARIYARSYDRTHTLELRQRGVEYEIRETIESALLFGRKTLEGLGMDELDATAIADDIRKRDEARLQLQAVEGITAGRELMINQPMQPEPLIKPRKEAAE